MSDLVTDLAGAALPGQGLAIGLTLAAGLLRGKTRGVATDLAVVAGTNAQAMDA